MSKKTAPAKKTIKLKQLKHKSEARPSKVKPITPPEKRVGFAFVGLGVLTLQQLLPAVAECKNVRIAGLVSGDPEKAAITAKQYGVPESCIYNYENFDDIKNNPDIDVVFIVLPNSMHEEFTIRSAKAGKHVLCEKPMATSVAGARRMIAACKKANVKLMVAYRMQYEPFATSIKEMIDKKKYGKTRIITSVNVQNTGSNHWRLDKKMAGGGCLMDMGIYNLNTTRFVLGEEPNMVLASTFSTPADKRFKEVEESVMFQLFFPSGTIANCTTSYGVANNKQFHCHCDDGGKLVMTNAFAYGGLTFEESYFEKGAEQKLTHSYGNEKNQFALEMDHMADCVMFNKVPYTKGEEGLQDHIIMDAIYRSARTKKPVKITSVMRKDAFRGSKPKKA